MSDYEDQLIGIAIDNFLTNVEKVEKEERLKMYKIIDHYAKSQQHWKVVNQLFESLRRNIKKGNFLTTGKRFLILVDQILEQSYLKLQYKPYSDLVSQQLVECYVYVFSLIFHRQILEASIDWKVYRLLWAKSIHDHVFNALRQEIASKYRNFDLNIGLSQDNINRIKKRYARKGFTQEEIKNYMESELIQDKKSPPLPHSHETVANKTRDESESSSSNEPNEDLRKDPRKKFHEDRKKVFQDPSPQPPQPPMHILPHHPNLNGSYRNEATLQVHNGQPQYFTNYQPQPMYPPIYPPNGNIRSSVSPFQQPYPSPYRSPDPPNIPLAQSKKRKEQPVNQSDLTTSITLLSLRQRLLQNLYECKQCGLMFQSLQNLKRHQQEHLFSAQQQLEKKQASKASQNQTNQTGKDDTDSNQLLSVKEWVQGGRAKEQEALQQISIRKLPADKQNSNHFTCYFCQGQLRIVWCEILEEWTLEEAVKVRQNKVDIVVAHRDCYQEFVPGGEGEDWARAINN